MTRRFMKNALIFFISVLMLNACDKDANVERTPTPVARDEHRKTNFGKLLGDDFLLFGGNKRARSGSGGTAAAVNPYLWRASLDSISFIPLVSADAVGGAIISDWYSAPQTPQERVKVNIFILDSQLRADALKVSIFKQVQGKNGSWVPVTADPNMAREMEDIILSKARQLKISSSNK